MNSTSAFWSRQLHFHIGSTWQPSNPIERNAAPYASKIAPEQRSGDDERKSDRGVQTTRQNPPRDSRPIALVAAGWHDPALRVASRGGAKRAIGRDRPRDRWLLVSVPVWRSNQKTSRVPRGAADEPHARSQQ